MAKAHLAAISRPGALAALGLREDDLCCPICMAILTDPFVTSCGHSFCFSCITTHLQNRNSCPSCSNFLTKDHIFPNFLLNKVISKAAAASSVAPQHTRLEQVQQLLASENQALKLTELNSLLQTLWERKQQLEQQEAEANLELLLHFLHHSRGEKVKKLRELQDELSWLEKDIAHVEGKKRSPPSSEAVQPAALLGLPFARQPSSGLQAQQAQEAQQAQAPRPQLHQQQQHPVKAEEVLAMHPQPPPVAHPQRPSRQPFSDDGNQSGPADPMGAAAAGLMAPPPGLPGGMIPALPGLGRPPAYGLFGPTGQHLSASVLGLDFLPPPEVLAAQMREQQMREQEPQPAGGLLHQAPLWSDMEEAESPWQQQQPPLEGPHANGGMRSSTGGGSSRPGVAGGYNVIQHQAGQAAFAGGQALGEAPTRRSVQDTHDPTAAGSQPPGASAGTSTATDPRLRDAARAAGDDGARLSHDDRADSMPAAQLGDTIRLKKRRLASQFDDLQQCYLRLRKPEAAPQAAGKAAGDSAGPIAGPPGNGAPSTSKPGGSEPAAVPKDSGAAPAEADPERASSAPPANGAAKPGEEGADHPEGAVSTSSGLAEFSRMLSVFTHCGKLKVIAELPRASTRQSSSILSSIEFDRDSQVFATAGVSKRISIFEYAAVMNNPHADVHCPAMELVTRSKLSCLSWNKYIKSHLVSSDYEGVVTLWDVNSSQMVMEYEAHEKRIWSVDFCYTDPMLLVSGSDDGWVKLWSTRQPNSVCEIDMKANVCCVKYNPGSTYEVAIGSADHNVHLYDLRKAHEPVYVFSGHRKAVSYVRYLNSREVVSASTDSTLRMWNTQSYVPMRSYSGHTNEKNFVGLSADGEFVACGSETNEVFVYYKAMSKPVARRLFSAPATPPAPGAPVPTNQETSQFISAVCWKPYSQVLLAANSQGTIKVMQLTS